MNQTAPFAFLFLVGTVLSLYGWWCLFRTDSAVNFGRNYLLGDRGNRLVTKLHGVLSIVIGPSMCIFSIAHFLGASWAGFGGGHR
jgi:hypothetical protein